MLDTVHHFFVFCFLSILCRPKVPDLRQHLRVSTPSIPGGCVMHLGLRSLSTQQERPPGEVRSISNPATRGQSMRSRRRRSQVSVHCVRLAARSLSLTQRTRILRGGRGSTAAVASDAAPWMDCTTAARASLRTPTSCRPTSGDAPMWASRFWDVRFPARNWNGSVNRKLQAQICMENKTIKYWKILPPHPQLTEIMYCMFLLCWVCTFFTSSYLTLNLHDSFTSLFSPSFFLFDKPLLIHLGWTEFVSWLFK